MKVYFLSETASCKTETLFKGVLMEILLIFPE